MPEPEKYSVVRNKESRVTTISMPFDSEEKKNEWLDEDMMDGSKKKVKDVFEVLESNISYDEAVKLCETPEANAARELACLNHITEVLDTFLKAGTICTECSGSIKKENPIALRTGCSGSACAYPCNSCGRLHWEDGTAVFNRPGNKAYLQNGEIIHKDNEGNVITYT
jgi:hypothetical protein